MKLALFDFGGTITSRDTLIDFILYAHGYVRSCLALILLSPIQFAYKIQVILNCQAEKKTQRLQAGGSFWALPGLTPFRRPAARHISPPRYGSTTFGAATGAGLGDRRGPPCP